MSLFKNYLEREIEAIAPSSLSNDRLWIFSSSATSLTSGDPPTAITLDAVDNPPGIIGTSLGSDGTGITILDDGVYTFNGKATFVGTVGADPGTLRTVYLTFSGPGDEPAESTVLSARSNDSGVNIDLLVGFSAINLPAGTTVGLMGSQQSGETLDTFGWLYGRRLG